MKVSAPAILIFGLTIFGMTFHTEGAEWSNTEMHLQFGKLERPSFAGRGNEETFIVTLQHADSWKYGDNFGFVDFTTSDDEDEFNDEDFYGEWFSNLSLGKIFDRRIGVGQIRDVSMIMGVNFDADAHVLKFQPGVRFSWDIPGFTFLNTDFMAYIDENKGVGSGGAPKEDDGFMLDVNFAYPFTLYEQNLSIEGHAEYLSSLGNELGMDSSWWMLSQTQLRWNVSEHISIGIEWQLWINKLGDLDTDENAVQALFVLKF